MKCAFNVVDNTIDEFDTKNGKHVQNRLLVLSDASPAGSCLLHNIEYLMTPEEVAKWGDGKLNGTRVEISIKELEQNFSGKVRIKRGLVVPASNGK